MAGRGSKMSDSSSDTFPAWLESVDKVMSLFRKEGYTVKQDHTDKFDTLEKVGYEEYRNSVHNGDLLFCGGTHPLSKVIRYFSGKSKVSHVGIIFWWQKRLMLLESVETDGVRIIPLSQYINNYENSGHAYKGRVYIARHNKLHKKPGRSKAEPWELENALVDTLLSKAATLLNKKFSIMDFFSFFIHATTGHLKYDRNDAYLCSEFVAECFQTEGIGIEFPDDGYQYIAPEHVAMAKEVKALIEIDTALGAESFDSL